MKKTILKFIAFTSLAVLPKITSAQNEYCKLPAGLTPVQTLNTGGCIQDYEYFIPASNSDTIVVNVAISIQNGTALPGASINLMQDSTYLHWIANLNYRYSHIEQAVANVGNTPYVPDTRIRFNLVGIYREAGGTPYPAYLGAVRINIWAGADGNGASGGYAMAHPISVLPYNPIPYIDFFLTSGDLIGSNYSLSNHFKSGQLNHEMGHILGLMHPDGKGYYYGGCTCTDDMFDDTYYPDCSSTSGAQCGTDQIVVGFSYPNGITFPGVADTCTLHGVISNNVMGYNGCQSYFSPKQMGYMRHTLFTSLKNYCLSAPAPQCYVAIPAQTFDLLPGVTALSQTHLSSGDIYIPAGSALIITGCLLMPENSHITVAPGATLIVDGGSILNACFNKMWGGIVVQGAYHSLQTYNGDPEVLFDATGQGLCIIKNGAHIERANMAVYVGGRTGRPSYLSTIAYDLKLAGGILQVDNSYFINCKRGIYFYPYKMMAKPGTKSYIKKTVFSPGETTQIAMYDYAIYLDGIGRVAIKGNTFNAATQVFNMSSGSGTVSFNFLDELSRGTGIIAVNSELYVKNNKFNDLRFAIKANNNYAYFRKTVVVSNKFIKNLFAVTGNLSYAKIDSNFFEIPQGLIDTVNIPAGSSKYPYGIYLDNSHTFKIETDTFYTNVAGIGGSGTGNGLLYQASTLPEHTCYGLIIKNSGNIGGEVKINNWFRNQHVATQTEQNNPNLQIRCNKYENNTLAWRVNPQSTTGILGTQGTGCATFPSSQYRANNTFLGCSSGKDVFESYLSTPFDYYYWNNTADIAGTQQLIPCTTSVNNSVNSLGCGNVPSADPNVCPIAPLNLVVLKEIREKALDLILADKEEEALTYLLSNAAYDEVRMLLISYYYGKGDAQSMQQYINQLPLTKEETKQFRLLYTLLRILMVQNKDVKEMSHGQIKQVEEIALSKTRAGSEARNLLDYIGKKENRLMPEVPYRVASVARVARPAEEAKINERPAELGQNIPNPANNSTIINMYVPENSSTAKVLILNNLGQLMLNKTLGKGEQQLNLTTSDFDNGIYFYTLYVDDKAIATKRMVIVK